MRDAASPKNNMRSSLKKLTERQTKENCCPGNERLCHFVGVSSSRSWRVRYVHSDVLSSSADRCTAGLQRKPVRSWRRLGRTSWCARLSWRCWGGTTSRCVDGPSEGAAARRLDPICFTRTHWRQTTRFSPFLNEILMVFLGNNRFCMSVKLLLLLPSCCLWLNIISYPHSLNTTIMIDGMETLGKF